MDSSTAKLLLNLIGYKRKPTRQVGIGSVTVGVENPICLQTMTTTKTNSIEKTVEQFIRVVEAGAEMVRLTTQGIKEAQSLGQIKEVLRQKGYTTPIIADIHFNPKVALEAANYADKIRINPGNYADKSRTTTYTFNEDEYEHELENTEKRFLELLLKCKKNGVAMRIGVNHGSLSHRIMSRYGDTPLGMAQSAMEFLRICRKHDYHNVVVSMKSSNTRVMVQATRYVVTLMRDEEMSYPLHLGVTEAGEGEDGRIKSAVGIGALLIDGIGDTIRVSLTEEPENEIPAARTLASLFADWKNQKSLSAPSEILANPLQFARRHTKTIENVGGENLPVVVANLEHLKAIESSFFEKWGWEYSAEQNEWLANENSADYFFIGSKSPKDIPNHESLPLIGYDSECQYGVVDQDYLETKLERQTISPSFVEVDISRVNPLVWKYLKDNPEAIIMLKAKNPYGFYSARNFIFTLMEMGISNPCITAFNFPKSTTKTFQIDSAAVLGALFIDGLSDGIMLSASQAISQTLIRATSFGILQASRARITKTEFISCPGCGRTQFNLNETLQKVKQRTSHLKGLKIGVMGCIVNGPGEMADADYGYVGSSPQRVTLYRKKEVVKKNIPEHHAVDELILQIKANGDWVEE